VSGILERTYWSASTYFKAQGEAMLPYRPLPEILARQGRRVRAMVAHAHASVPHYREVMQELGLHPADLRSADSLAALPLVSGRELAETPERFYSGRYDEASTLTLHSSGTGGRAKAVRYDKAALFETLAHGHRQRAVVARFTGKLTSYREMSVIRAESVSTQMRRFYETHAWVPRSMDVQRQVLPLELPFHEMVRRINEFRPHLLLGYGSHLGALLRWAWEHGGEIHRPCAVRYGADAMPLADLELIETKLGVPVLSTYQADEALRIGFQCEQRKGFHLSLDDVAVRVMKPDGSPAGPGEQGEVVISNLSNRATVLLNYRLGDVVTMPTAPCTCGRTLPIIEQIAGRADDMVLLPDGQSRHSLLFMAPMHGVPGVVQVQLVQESLAALSVRVVCDPGGDWPSIKGSVEQVARRLLGEGLAVSACKVTEIPREASGKTRAVISHCGPAHD
jgi:phenylacetate-CoA ligase